MGIALFQDIRPKDSRFNDARFVHKLSKQLGRENYATRKLNFAKQKTELLFHANVHFSRTSHVI